MQKTYRLYLIDSESQAVQIIADSPAEARAELQKLLDNGESLNEDNGVAFEPLQEGSWTLTDDEPELITDASDIMPELK